MAAAKPQYKTITAKNINQYKRKIIDFYNHYFPEESNRLITKNSSVFFIATENKEIIGCCRLLTDFSRNAILFDLIVRKAKRNQGIGKKLTKEAIKYCKSKFIKKIYLMTDPRRKWLKNLYQKTGFCLAPNQILMRIEY